MTHKVETNRNHVQNGGLPRTSFLLPLVGKFHTDSSCSCPPILKLLAPLDGSEEKDREMPCYPVKIVFVQA